MFETIRTQLPDDLVLDVNDVLRMEVIETFAIAKLGWTTYQHRVHAVVCQRFLIEFTQSDEIALRDVDNREAAGRYDLYKVVIYAIN